MKPYSGGLRHDYKDLCPAAPGLRRKRHWSWLVLGLVLPPVTVALLLVSAENESKVPSGAGAFSSAPPLEKITLPPLGLREGRERVRPAAAAELLRMPPAPPLASASLLDLAVASGDSLERLFRRNGLSLADLAAMVELDTAAEHLQKLRPGDRIRVAHRDGRVLTLSRQIGDSRLLSIARGENGFDARTIELPVEVREQTAHGTIETSLFEAGASAGMSDSLIMSMAGIFQWDIDFIQDVRVGDTFTVIYEERWREDARLGDGRIVAAEFVNRGRVFRAARYTDAGGRSDYYTPEGRSVRKAFIRAPVDFTRISSTFDPNRRHPVLNTIRAHRGVDYAAPTGTPVRAAGDGKISSRGANGGYGNAVIIKHGGNITTLYAHLSRFGSQRVGTRVEQGDVIGYVGQSGLATGPHLHYEYRVNGVHRNPRTVQLPPADPVPEQYREDFETKTAALWQRLDLYQSTRFATTSDP